MKIRAYRPEDCTALAELFYETVHSVNASDYSPEQLDAWATGSVDEAGWNESFLRHMTRIAEMDGEIVGFADMDESGYLDRLYVHRDHQREGVARALADALERAVDAEKYTTHASITARGFFEKRGWRVVRAQRVIRHGEALTNFVMERENPK